MSRQTLLNSKLSENFTLQELVNSTVASEKMILEQFNPDENVVERLRELCINVLQPVRDKLGKPLTITSGYRCSKVNELVNGSKNSDHLYGMAADIICDNNWELFQTIKSFNFKQLIWEYNGQWVHVSYDKNNNKKEILYIS